MTIGAAELGAVLHQLGPQVLGALVRRHGQFDTCEDAVSEALLAATAQWPTEGVPANPYGWLMTVAGRRLIDQVRGDRARRDRETATANQRSDPGSVPDSDDSLTLLFLCCHPSLAPASQIALTLRAVGGLTTAQIAQAFLVPEATMAQRISRAKQRIKATGASFTMPPPDEFGERLRAVQHVLYLIFNEGYTASNGAQLQRRELAAETIRLTRELHRQLPGNGEVAGLLALMLLTDAHRAARIAPDGGLVPLADQDRTRWDRTAITEGVSLITEALRDTELGPYQVQAAIAAVHAEALTAEQTDWPQVVALYGVLAHLAPNPMVTLNRAVAVAMVDGPRAGLALLESLAADERMAGHHRLPAVRAHLLELTADLDAAAADYRLAARLTTSRPEQRYLERRAARLAPTPTPTEEDS